MNLEARHWCQRRSFMISAGDHGLLQALKGTTRVSVVIPARDEAPTIGNIVTAIHDAHVLGSQLVDELIVIDSDSRDATAEVARAAGATVHSAAEIRADLGWRPGKGEAMWKSLLVSSGEIVIFIDADLTTFTADYVTGLLAPLLREPEVLLVKAFYDRDLADAPEGIAQGGRVNELMARPLINLWWPDLAGVVQPLAGEWAGRRQLLETQSFPSGYGVEFATLIDTYERHGLDALAQVDLGNRGHVHQDLRNLGILSAEVLAAATRRRFGVEPQGVEEIAHLVRSEASGERDWESRLINDLERPPVLALLPAEADSAHPQARS